MRHTDGSFTLERELDGDDEHPAGLLRAEFRKDDQGLSELTVTIADRHGISQFRYDRTFEGDSPVHSYAFFDCIPLGAAAGPERGILHRPRANRIPPVGFCIYAEEFRVMLNEIGSYLDANTLPFSRYPSSE